MPPCALTFDETVTPDRMTNEVAAARYEALALDNMDQPRVQ
jgi:hypothetical protein